MYNNAVWGLGATTLTLAPLGASVFPTIIKPLSAAGAQLKALSLGNSGVVQVLPNAISGASIAGLSGVGSSFWGYALGASEILQWNGPAVFYLAATGNTCTVSMLCGMTEGATLG